MGGLRSLVDVADDVYGGGGSTMQRSMGITKETDRRGVVGA